MNGSISAIGPSQRRAGRRFLLSLCLGTMLALFGFADAHTLPREALLGLSEVPFCRVAQKGKWTPPLRRHLKPGRVRPTAASIAHWRARRQAWLAARQALPLHPRPHAPSGAARQPTWRIQAAIAPPPSAPPPTGGQAIPPVVDPHNLYSETFAGKLSPAIADALPRAYVPDRSSNDVYVIDPNTLKVVDRFPVGLNPQHVVPSWDLKTLWVTNDAEKTSRGSLTPIDPTTGRPGIPIAVDDPYNMYFTPDGSSAIVVAEARQRLDFRDPHTMALQASLPAPQCAGINHADFAIDGSYAIFTCEFDGSLVKINLIKREVEGYLRLSKGGMPQDVRISPDGKIFYVADMHADGVFLIDGASFTEVGFIPTGVGTHGLYPSRDGKKLYVSNRGSHLVIGTRHGQGSVSVIDFAGRRVEQTWAVPGGGSPDMGDVSADGKQLWLSGRFDDVVYVFDTANGSVSFIPVGREPHGLAVWPQPGRYSLGHTGVMR